MDDDNFVIVLESFINTWSLQGPQVNTKKVPVLNHLVLTKKWGNVPEKALNMISCTTQHVVHTVLYPSISRQFMTNDHQLRY